MRNKIPVERLQLRTYSEEDRLRLTCGIKSIDALPAKKIVNDVGSQSVTTASFSDVASENSLFQENIK